MRALTNGLALFVAWSQSMRHPSCHVSPGVAPDDATCVQYEIIRRDTITATHIVPGHSGSRLFYRVSNKKCAPFLANQSVVVSWLKLKPGRCPNLLMHAWHTLCIDLVSCLGLDWLPTVSSGGLIFAVAPAAAILLDF